MKIEKTKYVAVASVLLAVALMFADLSLAAGGLRPTGELKANQVTEVVALLENPRDSSSLRLNADYFVKPYFSIGEATPIMPDPVRSWQTFQTKLWIPNAASQSETKFF